MTRPGDTVGGRYAVLRALSEGGMGTVWLGKDLTLQRTIVIKVPKIELLADPRFVLRFRREVEALRRLEHPSIIPILDTGTAAGVPYVVMPYLPGGTLADRLEARTGRRAVLAEVVAWLGPVAAALDHLRANGYVHRDVKPSNVLFDAHGRPFLTDFGIALALGTSAPDQRLTQTSAFMPGTPIYMAPEQAFKGKLTGAVDQYALAITAFEALTGTLPFRGATPMEILLQKRAGHWVLGSDTPVASASIQALRRAMASEPAKRFPSCGAFIQALAAGAGSAPRAGATPDSKDRPQRRSGSWPRAALPAAALLLGVLAWASWPTSGRDGAGRPPPEPTPPRPTADGPPAPAPAPTPALPLAQGDSPVPPSIQVELPAEGQVVKDLSVRFAGSVQGRPPPRTIQVNGASVPVKDGAFDGELDVSGTPDGPLEISFAAPDGSGWVQRRVALDRAAPVLTLEIESPHVRGEKDAIGYTPYYVVDPATVRIRAVAEDPFLKSIACSECESQVATATPAEWTVAFGPRAHLLVRVSATDTSGHVTWSGARLVRRPALGDAWPPDMLRRPSDGLVRRVVRILPDLGSSLALGLHLRVRTDGPTWQTPDWMQVGSLRGLDPAPGRSAEPLRALLVPAPAWSPDTWGPEMACAAPPGPPARRREAARAGSDPGVHRIATGGGAVLPLALAPPLTWEAWVRLDPEASGWMELVRELGPDWATCRLRGSSVGAWLNRGALVGRDISYDLPSQERGTWTHVALTLTDDSLGLFVNGADAGAMRSTGRHQTWGASALPMFGCEDPSSVGPRKWMGAWRQVRISRGIRYKQAFQPATTLTADGATTVLYDPSSFDQGAFWPEGSERVPLLPGGVSAVAGGPGAPSGPEPAAGAWVTEFDSLSYRMSPAPGEFTAEVRTAGVLGWGRQVLLTCADVSLCVEDGVPSCYARQASSSAGEPEVVRVQAGAPLTDPSSPHVFRAVRGVDALEYFVDGRSVARATLRPLARPPKAEWFRVRVGGTRDPQDPIQCVAAVTSVRVLEGTSPSGAKADSRASDAERIPYFLLEFSELRPELTAAFRGKPLPPDWAGPTGRSHGGALVIVPAAR